MMSEQLELLHEVLDLLTRARAPGNKQKALGRLTRIIEIQERAEGVHAERQKCRHGLPADYCRICWDDRKKREGVPK
jgi:hypothetical protein